MPSPEETEKQRKAGLARAATMTPKERKSLATKAAHARWKKAPDGIALATHEGVVRLGTMELPCAVLKDGRRILSERGLSAAFTHIRSGSDFKKRGQQSEEQRLPIFVSEQIAEFLPAAAREKLAKPIRFRQQDEWSIPAWGVEASLLADICDAYLSARDAGVLKSPASLRKAAAAERLMRALAKVALDALIDEATGYQVERDKDELQRLLNVYVREEFRPWTSTFPPTFYREIFRLRNLTTDDVRKRPAYFGKLTNNIVYERLLPGMVKRLAEVNPVSEDTGRRARKHFQHLSENDGYKHLKDHLTGLLFLMRASKSWDDLIERLDVAAPRQVEEGA